MNLELRVGVTISGKQGIRDGTAGYSMLDTRYPAGLTKINRLGGFHCWILAGFHSILLFLILIFAVSLLFYGLK